MTRRQYSNPPIVEAVCEFRFAPGQAWNLTVPGLFYEKIKDSYPGEPQQQNLIAAEVLAGQLPANPEFALRSSLNKLLFQSANATRLVGIGPDTLSIHSLRPYQGWDEFKQNIDQAFQVYLDVVKPIGVTRIALRYINQIDIPSNEEIKLNDYFTVYPQLPEEGVPSRMSAFSTRLELIYPDTPIKLVLNLSDAVPPPGQIVIILDLEIFQEWVEKSLHLQEALSNLYVLKQREGQAFENLITDRTRELFNVVK
jgi:uncharacterized protein (TIGR04255 family)